MDAPTQSPCRKTDSSTPARRIRRSRKSPKRSPVSIGRALASSVLCRQSHRTGATDATMAKSANASRPPNRKMRCAIYTRKSSEEGLEQAFNSLDAQREACAAFVLSQKHEGWVVSPALYDDGGFSGGTMDRPALQRLLSDIREGKVDVVVVYKIDRLTRSLFDF